MNREEINTIHAFLEHNNLLGLSQDALKITLNNNKKLKELFLNFFKFLGIRFKKYNYHSKIKIVTTLYERIDTFANLQHFINIYLLDKENEVSCSGIKFFIKIFPELNYRILEFTKTYPKELTIVGRCELIRKNIIEFPKCKECANSVSWAGASRLLEYCSTQCVNKSIERINKMKKTKFAKYDDENFTNRELGRKTSLKKYGDKNYNNPTKQQETCLKNFGVRNPSQSPEIYKKIQKSLFTVKQYKNTNLQYQGSYELYFLELMDKKGFLREITTPLPVPYILNDQEYIYNPDFQFREKIIEIKSTWTYNKNGSDIKLEEKNNAKWHAVQNIIVLKEKGEIKKFIDSIIL